MEDERRKPGGPESTYHGCIRGYPLAVSETHHALLHKTLISNERDDKVKYLQN